MILQGHLNSIVQGSLFQQHYEIESVLGEGAHGIVYRARQLTTGQWVAIKVMSIPRVGGKAATEKRLARFLRERQLCSQLHHPNIVRLIDAGTSEEGLAYTVLEYAEGITLRRLLAEEGKLSPPEARRLMLEVLDAMTCAHRRRVVHRDLKPSNIMVTATGARRHALVLDFGIGCLLDGVDAPTYVDLTQTGDTLGTPGYAAPEQLRGAEATPGSDIFAWGLMLMECVTGTPAYSGGSPSEIVFEQLGPNPVPIPRELAGHPFENLVRWTTDKDVAARASSAEAVMLELEACEMSAQWSQWPSTIAGQGSNSSFPDEERAETPNRSFESGRRLVAALVCTLSAPLETCEEAGSEEADERARSAAGYCRKIAHRRGGHLASSMGNQLLFYFGYPRATEKDTARAAQAALEIVGNASDASTSNGGEPVDPEVRCGIHAEVMTTHDARSAGERSGLGLGRTTTIAAYLARKAQPGSVLITEQAATLLHSGFDLEPSEVNSHHDSRCAGKVLRIVRKRDPRDTVSATFLGPAFVGREQELRLLDERWRRAKRGAGQCSIITGEPGIGKTRLIREIHTIVSSEDCRVLECACSPDAQGIALNPLIELLNRPLGLEGSLEPTRKAEQLEAQLSGYGFALRETVPLFARLLGVPLADRYPALTASPAQLRERTFNAILSFLFQLAEHEPVLIVIEDLHWADPTTLELLSLLVRDLPSSRVLALFSARPEFAPTFPTTGVLQLCLGPLEEVQVESMAKELAGARELSREALTKVWQRTEGVPLFVEEFMRTAVRTGTLPRFDSDSTLTDMLENSQIPQTLRSLLTARLDQVGSAKETAQVAAVLGREFDFDALVAVHPGGTGRVASDLERLADADLVHRRRGARNQRCIFRHALIRDAAYESLSRASRAHVHSLVASAFERQFPNCVTDRPDLLAHHHWHAGHPKEALGYGVRATQLAMDRAAYREACRQAQTALEWFGNLENPDEEAVAELDLLSLLLFALLSAGGSSTELSAVARRCFEAIERVADAPRAIPAMWRIALYCVHADRPRAVQISSRLLTSAERTGDVGQQVALLGILAQCLLFEARFAEARDRAEHALALYDRDAHRQNGNLYGIDSKVQAHILLALVHSAQGNIPEAVRQVEAGVAWSNEIGHAMSLVNALMFWGMVYQTQLDRARVGGIVANGMEIADRHGLDWARMYFGILDAWAQRSVADADRCLAQVYASGMVGGITYWSGVVAETHATCGEYVKALSLVEKAIESAKASGEVYQLPELQKLRADYLQHIAPGDLAAVKQSPAHQATEPV